jgi:flagellar hook-length control protein FliK
MTGQRLQTAEIAVNPPNLGGIEVRLSLHEQGAGAQFFAANPSVREALDAALPRLRDMLAEAGISLLQAEVRDQAFAQSQSWRGGQGSGQGAGAVGAVHALPLGRASGQGLIDLYA